MTLTWSDLVEEIPDVAGPLDAVTGKSSVAVVGYDRHVIAEADASGLTLVRDTLTEHFTGGITGGITGEGHAEHLRHLHPDGSNTFVGIERLTVTIDGRHGSVSLTCHGTTSADGVVHGVWHVIPGSGADGLTGLRGRGEFIARQQANGPWQATDTFTHWYDEEGPA
jgi:hypothetical protein